MTPSVGFPEVVDAQVRILILGSLPGVRSLEARRYYAHPTNAFWRLVSRVLEEDLAGLDYPARLERLLARHVGLWDVVREARRRGSLDANIREASTNDLPALIAALPSLKAVAFNGGKAAKDGLKQLSGRTEARLIALPSSSAAYASKPFAEKAEAWSVLREYLD